MTLRRGVLPPLGQVSGDAFAALVPSTGAVGINLDQSSPQALRSNIVPGGNWLSWAQGLAKQAIDAGRDVVWSVPFPGARQLEAVNYGTHDGLYLAIARAIQSVSPRGKPIEVRLPWEFDLKFNPENVFLDKNGKPAPELGTNAWRRLAGLFKASGNAGDARGPVKTIWSPAVQAGWEAVVDPLACWPGNDMVDVIAPDLYLCRGFGHVPGGYTSGYFRIPFLRLREFADAKFKPFGLAETGVDGDEMVADFAAWLADANGAKQTWRAMYWNQVLKRSLAEGDVDIRLDDRPKVAAAFKAGTG